MVVKPICDTLQKTLLPRLIGPHAKVPPTQAQSCRMEPQQLHLPSSPSAVIRLQLHISSRQRDRAATSLALLT